MDKAVEELQQELKILKNEIKETLTDVREVLLNTVENPFPQEALGSLMASPVTPAPAAAPAAPPPPAVAEVNVQQPAAPPPPPPPQQAAAPAPAYPVMGGGGGPPIVIGNLGGGGGGGFPNMPMQMGMPQAPMNMGAMPMPQQMDAPDQADVAVDHSDHTAPMGGPGLPPASRPSGASRPTGASRSNGGSRPTGASRPSGPGLPPGGTMPRRQNGAAQAEVEADTYADTDQAEVQPSRGKAAKADARKPGRGDRPQRTRGPMRGQTRVQDEYADFTDDEYDEYDEYDGYDDQDNDESAEARGRKAQQPKGKVDLVVLASLSGWLTDGISRMGRKRVSSLLEVYASMGGIPTNMKDVLLQIVALDDTEGVAAPVSVQDTMRFLIELDDLMWRGRQDWRRAALMTMLGPVLHGSAE